MLTPESPQPMRQASDRQPQRERPEPRNGATNAWRRPTFTDEQIKRCALEHGVVPRGLNTRGEDVRNAWADPDDLEQIRRAVGLLVGVRTVKTKAAADNSSYGLKHRLERASGTYISNGACILACLLLGMPTWRPTEQGDPNLTVGISQFHTFPGEVLAA